MIGVIGIRTGNKGAAETPAAVKSAELCPKLTACPDDLTMIIHALDGHGGAEIMANFIAVGASPGKHPGSTGPGKYAFVGSACGQDGSCIVLFMQ